jgi:nucleotide-binding universal stress UspA family protein
MYTGLGTIEETLSELLQSDTPVARHLRRGAEILAKYNVHAELKLRHGAAAFEIVREIDLEDYDLAVIGASGADTTLKEWLFGSIAQTVVDCVGIPVLVINQTRAKQKSFEKA